MNVTPEQIAALTDRHKILVKYPGAPEHIKPVELELWLDEYGHLRNSLGLVVRWAGGNPAATPDILEIIEPPHEWQYGDVIGDPRDGGLRAVFLPTDDDGGLPWMSSSSGSWMTQEWADEQLANGWVIDPDSKQGNAAGAAG